MNFNTPFALAAGPKPGESAEKVTVTGQAPINVTANWNESRDGTAIYQAPDGQEIESATIRVHSAAKASYQVSVSNDRRQAIHTAHTRGSGEWWNKERGWYNGDLEIVLVPKKA